MHNWGKHFGLVELHKVKISNTAFWEQLDLGHHIRLTKKVSIEAERFAALEAWDKATARAAAVGLSVRTAVVSGRAAARLQGIEILGVDPTVELQHLDGKKPAARSCWPAGVIYRSCYLSADQVVEEHGVKVTRILRTVADIARFHGVLEGLVALDSVRRKWPRLSSAQLESGLLGKFPYRGSRQVREVLCLSIPNSGSVPESMARLLLIQADLTQVRTIKAQARIYYGPYRQHYDVDLLVNGWLIIEVDGEIKYDGETYGPVDEVIRDERIRETDLQNQDYVVLRVRYPQLLPRADGTCEFLELVAAMLARYPDRGPVQ